MKKARGRDVMEREEAKQCGLEWRRRGSIWEGSDKQLLGGQGAHITHTSTSTCFITSTKDLKRLSSSSQPSSALELRKETFLPEDPERALT